MSLSATQDVALGGLGSGTMYLTRCREEEKDLGFRTRDLGQWVCFDVVLGFLANRLGALCFFGSTFLVSKGRICDLNCAITPLG